MLGPCGLPGGSKLTRAGIGVAFKIPIPPVATNPATIAPANFKFMISSFRRFQERWHQIPDVWSRVGRSCQPVTVAGDIRNTALSIRVVRDENISGAVRQASNRNHDLAEEVARGELTESLGSLVERKNFVYNWLDPIGF